MVKMIYSQIVDLVYRKLGIKIDKELVESVNHTVIENYVVRTGRSLLAIDCKLDNLLSSAIKVATATIDKLVRTFQDIPNTEAERPTTISFRLQS